MLKNKTLWNVENVKKCSHSDLSEKVKFVHKVYSGWHERDTITFYLIPRHII